MESLKLLVEMVKDLPDLAIWVIITYFVYKALVVGSIYGVIRYAVKALHDVLIARKTKHIDVEATIQGMAVKDGVHHTLIAQIARIKGVTSYGSCYIHESDVDFLRKAIDDRLKKEAKDKDA